VARQGVGAMLIETAASWAQDLELMSLTLTTYQDVPWNRRYYASGSRPSMTRT